MQQSSILIKSITGKIYKITDLLNGEKIPLTEEDLRNYDMYPQSGVYKDIDGSLVDIAEIYASKNNVEILEEIPTEPKSNSLYIDKNERTISIYDENSDEFILLGSGGTTDSFVPENALTDEEIKNIVSLFKSKNNYKRR